ncbi:hypothetical protein [Tateyamaria sp. SN6-1]|uniref:hypothetical protein n=1 Tax=Tateyamaria sp. SN6-1 TaxID=3092148 RepID=UPI0039F482CD
MKSGFQSFKAIWETLNDSGALGPAFAALLAMSLAAGLIFLGVWLYRRYRMFRLAGGVRGIRTRKHVDTLRADGLLQGDVTFPDAVEMAQTGTLRKTSLEDKMVNCVVPLEMLFSCDDHGLYYQFEMGEWDARQVASWVEVVNALEVTEMTKVLEEVALMHDVICHPEFDGEHPHGQSTLGWTLWQRAAELRARVEESDGIARLRAACEAHLRKAAPDMLPLPTW